MKFIFSISILIVMSSSVMSQLNYSINDLSNDTANYCVKSQGSFQLNATSLSRDFLSAVYQGKFITRDIRSNISNKLFPFQNRFGGSINFGITYTQRINTLFTMPFYDLKYVITMENREYLNGAFSKDLFDLTFLGNKAFEGDTAHIGHSSITQLRYQKYGFGLITNNGMSKTYGLVLNILNGEQYFNIDTKNSTLYTAEYGDYLDLFWQMDYQSSDTGNTGLGMHNGLGLSADLYYDYSFDSEDRPGGVSFEINNLGFISWNNSLTYQIDTSIYFDGVYINQFGEFQDSIFTAVNRNNFLNRYNTSDQSDLFTYVPASFRLKWHQEQTEKVETVIGMHYMTNSNYKPMMYLQGNYAILSTLDVGLFVGYGGYGSLNTGLQLNSKLGPAYIQIGTYNIEGLLLTKSFGGTSGFITLKMKF